MKRKYILSGLLACALTFSACDVDLLDIPQKGVENEENYYQTDEQCESAIAAVYASWRNAYSGRGEKASQYANGFFLKNFLADDFNSGGARSDQVYAQEIYESAIVATNGWVENYYKRLYATIYLANLVIERFDAAESEVKARNIAEAKFFRAICYFELTTLWGTPPLVDRVLKNSEEYKVPNSTAEQLWKFMETDLTEAITSIYKDHKNMLGDGNGNLYGVSAFTGNAEAINPFAMRDNSYTKNRGFNINGSTYLNFMPIKGLTVTSRLSYRLASTSSYGVGQSYYYTDKAKRDWVEVSASDYSPTYYQWENFLNYTRSFGKHNATLMLGTSYSQSRSYGVSGSKKGYNEDTTDMWGNVINRVSHLGFLQNDPNFFYFAYATSDAVKDVSGGEPTYTRKLSYFGRLNYDYAGKYMAQFSLRADAADLSVLPKNKRWGYFPAVSLGWVLSEENFMKGTEDWLSQLKLRASWGQNGSTASLGGYKWNVSIGATGHLAVGDNNNFSYINGYAPSATGNDGLKWETSEQTNIGIDARFLNSRLTVTADYFHKKTKDLIVSGIKASTVVGNSFSPVNAGNITNKGFELELGWQDRIGDFAYGVRANVATLKNKVTKIHESLSSIDGATYVTYGAITRFEVGKPAWYFYGYDFMGVDSKTGEPIFRDIDGVEGITDNDKTEIGKGIADYTYGITLNAAWKGFDFILFGTGSQGNDVFCGLNRVDYNLNQLTYFTKNRWTESNRNGKTPASGATDYTKYLTSSGCVFDGSYFKIKQIQLGYSFPKQLIKKVAIENLRIYGSLEDFFTFTDYPGFDPEVTGVGNSLGVDKGSYPNSKKVVLGLSVTF